MSSAGSDEKLSGAKIQPLDSDVKYNTPLSTSDRGSAGTNRTLDQSRIDPLGGSKGLSHPHPLHQGHPHPLHHGHPAPHADSQGVIGRDATFGGAKIEPFGGHKESFNKSPGLDDENVDASRIDPMGEVLEDE